MPCGFVFSSLIHSADYFQRTYQYRVARTQKPHFLQGSYFHKEEKKSIKYYNNSKSEAARLCLVFFYPTRM
jgi:hypothetical protein